MVKGRSISAFAGKADRLSYEAEGTAIQMINRKEAKNGVKWMVDSFRDDPSEATRTHAKLWEAFAGMLLAEEPTEAIVRRFLIYADAFEAGGELRETAFAIYTIANARFVSLN